MCTVSSTLQRVSSGEVEEKPDDSEPTQPEALHGRHPPINFMSNNSHLSNDGNMHIMPSQPMMPMHMHMPTPHGMMPGHSGQGFPVNGQQGQMFMHSHNMPLVMPQHAHGQMQSPVGGAVFPMAPMNMSHLNSFLPPNVPGFGPVHHPCEWSLPSRLCILFWFSLFEDSSLCSHHAHMRAHAHPHTHTERFHYWLEMHVLCYSCVLEQSFVFVCAPCG